MAVERIGTFKILKTRNENSSVETKINFKIYFGSYAAII